MHEVIQQSEGQEGSFVHLVTSSSINCVTKFLYLHPLSVFCLLSERKWKKILLKIWSLKIMRKTYYRFSTYTVQRSKLVAVLSMFSPFECIDYKIRAVFGVDIILSSCRTPEAKSYYFLWDEKSFEGNESSEMSDRHGLWAYIQKEWPHFHDPQSRHRWSYWPFLP